MGIEPSLPLVPLADSRRLLGSLLQPSSPVLAHVALYKREVCLQTGLPVVLADWLNCYQIAVLRKLVNEKVARSTRDGNTAKVHGYVRLHTKLVFQMQTINFN